MSKKSVFEERLQRLLPFMEEIADSYIIALKCPNMPEGLVLVNGKVKTCVELAREVYLEVFRQSNALNDDDDLSARRYPTDKE
jgi:hypothetical protein